MSANRVKSGKNVNQRYIAEIDGFPFFVDEFEWSKEMDVGVKNRSMYRFQQNTKVESVNYDLRLEMGGHYIIRELSNICFDEKDSPRPVKVDVRPIRSKDQHNRFIFEGALFSAPKPKHFAGKNVLSVDAIAEDVTALMRQT